MTPISVEVHDLGKRFYIGGQQLPYHTLRDSLMNSLTLPARRIGRVLRGRPLSTDNRLREFWALRDISFRVEAGEVVGIIGHNGAGKSTLLKILSSITEPTEGHGRIYGRVASLLEVGTGFHMELTGRENIFLNGSILGMTRTEIRRKFDEIVAFAGVENFIDTPLKFYSSGMGLRLGFSVAAHLEPEILIIDEVLAVGDAEFQQKSLNKMGEVSRQGRTVLFVSHNLAAIQNLCARTLLLRNGELVMDGPTPEVLNHYRSALGTAQQIPLAEREDRSGSGLVRFTHLKVAGEKSVGLVSGEDAMIQLGFRCHTPEPLHNARFTITFFDPHGSRLFACSSHLKNKDVSTLPTVGTIECRVPHFPLNAGIYHVDLLVEIGLKKADHVSGAASIDVLAGDFFDSGQLPKVKYYGYVLVDQDWQLLPQ